MKTWTLSLLCFSLLSISPSYGSVSKQRADLLDMMGGSWLSQSIYCAAKLDVAAKIGTHPKAIDTLAELCQCNSDKLERIMRLLTSKGIFVETSPGIYANNEASELLSSQHPQSLNGLAIWYGEEMYDTFSKLYEGLKAKETPFELRYGSSVFQYINTHAETHKQFNLAMREKAMMAIDSCLSAYDFSQFGTIYDIGAGQGHFVETIVRKFPNITGVIFDVPETIDRIKTARSELVAGDFFKSVPKGGDCYLLKSIVHDWDDERAAEILRNCASAMTPKSRLIIVEPLLTGLNEPDYAKMLDILMLAVTGGRERTLAEMSSLAQECGLEVEKVIPTATEFKIIVTRKAR